MFPSFFSSLKFHNTLFPFFYTYSTLLCHMIVPIYTFTSLGYAEISSLRALSLRVYWWSISFLRSGWIAYISGFPTLLAKCWGHSSYSVSLSNCTPKQSSNLTKTRSSRAKSLDTNHIFFQLYQSWNSTNSFNSTRLLILEIWILAIELKKLFCFWRSHCL